MDSEARLTALWAVDDPSAHDPAFVLATLARLARRRFWMDVARLAPPVIAAGFICWAAAPAVEAMLQTSGMDVAPALFAAAGLAIAALFVAEDWPLERFSASI